MTDTQEDICRASGNPPRIAIFIDALNLKKAVERMFPHDPHQVNYERLYDFFQRRGRIARAAIYFVDGIRGDNEDDKKKKEAWEHFLAHLRRVGFFIYAKPLKRLYNTDTHAVSFKGNCDVEIAVDMTALIDNAHIDEVILMSGDGDFAYLLERAHQRKIHTVVVGLAHRTARELRKICDEFISLESIADKCIEPRPVRIHNLRHAARIHFRGRKSHHAFSRSGART